MGDRCPSHLKKHYQGGRSFLASVINKRPELLMTISIAFELLERRQLLEVIVQIFQDDGNFAFRRFFGPFFNVFEIEAARFVEIIIIVNGQFANFAEIRYADFIFTNFEVSHLINECCQINSSGVGKLFGGYFLRDKNICAAIAG